MREIVLDTETTGMDPADGDRVVEIGCVELINHIPTGRTYHQYINPERDMPPEAEAVHGLSADFLSGHPTFGEIVGDFMEFVEGGRLVIHNAAFDVKFLNAELKAFGFKGWALKECIDTLKVAREKFPGSPASLDALCRRFNIDNTGRVLHGALLDAELLAEVYLELSGGRQHGLGLGEETKAKTNTDDQTVDLDISARDVRPPRDFPLSEEELKAHQDMLEEIDGALWSQKG